MSELDREKFVEILDTPSEWYSHVQPLDMLRMAAAAETAGLPHSFPPDILLELDLDEPVLILDSSRVVHNGLPFRTTWGLALLTTREHAVAVQWDSPADTYDDLTFEIDTPCVTSRIDLAGLIKAIEQAAYDDLLT